MTREKEPLYDTWMLNLRFALILLVFTASSIEPIRAFRRITTFAYMDFRSA